MTSLILEDLETVLGADQRSFQRLKAFLGFSGCDSGNLTQRRILLDCSYLLLVAKGLALPTYIGFSRQTGSH